MAADEGRALLIYSCLEHELLDGHTCLVLAQSLAILEKLFSLAQRAGRPAAYISGASKKSDRAAAIAGMRAARCAAWFATYQLAKEGLDIPRADRLFLASPVRDSVIVQQSAGRIMRPGAGQGRCPDIRFCGQGRARLPQPARGAAQSVPRTEMQYSARILT